MARSLREKIYQGIRDDITYGKLAPGERIVESRLVEQFKTSRSPIREALRQLDSEGLVRIERNTGITVTKLSIKEIDEIYNLRWLLESYAAYLTAKRATRNQVAELRKLHEKAKASTQACDLMGWLQDNTRFHRYLQKHSGNKNLDRILEILNRRVYRYRYITAARISDNFKDYIHHHEGILRGCEANDGKMAEDYMKLHLKTIKEAVIDYLTKFPGF
jgi:DNA-binding GntR family transcriptional regulator